LENFFWNGVKFSKKDHRVFPPEVDLLRAAPRSVSWAVRGARDWLWCRPIGFSMKIRWPSARPWIAQSAGTTD